MFDAPDAYVCDDLSLSVALDESGERATFTLEARVPLVVERFSVSFEHDFLPGDRVLLNGYQSWTDTRWHRPFSFMRGLAGVPRRVVDRFALDAMGDYRFTTYEQSPGFQHGFTYGVLKSGAGYELLGSTDESRGFTLVRLDATMGEMTLDPEVPVQTLVPGQSCDLLQMALVRGASEDEVFDRWFGLAGWKVRPVRPLVGYSSWYRHYGDIDAEKLARDLAGAKIAFAQLHAQGMPASAQTLFQVDDGWCKVGDWLEPDTEKFPLGMADLASSIAHAGFLPGLWLAPFVCEKESSVFSEHPDWLLRDAQGNLRRTGPHWSGAYALDVLNPQVIDYVTTCLRTAVQDWGFKFVKLDFLYAACLDVREGKTRGRIMHEAVQLLRRAVGEDCLIDGCGVPLGSAFGVFDYCRIGCDVGLDWDDAPHMRLLHRERVSTKNAVGNVAGRAPLDGRAFGNDPDVVFLRGDIRLTQEQKLDVLASAANYGSMLLTSDDMGKWSLEDLAVFRAGIDILCNRKVGKA